MCSLTAADAEPFSGNDIFHSCRTQDVSVQQGFCVGFILGSVEAMKWGSLMGVVSTNSGEWDDDEFDLASSLALGFCVPSEVDNRQVLDIVQRYLASHPEIRHESARTLIHKALREAFPC